MLKEAMELLLECGESQADVIVKPLAEPPHVYGVRLRDGTISWRHANPPPSGHKANTLQAIVDLAKRACARVDAGEGFAEVWYGPDAVVTRFGDSSLRNTVSLPLQFSEPYLKLTAWKDRRAVTQPDLVRELRITFRDCLQHAGALVETIRRVRFANGTVTESEVGHGKASLGKQIMGEVTGVGAIPEYVVFNLPVFANPCFVAVRAAVECAINPDPATGSFRVVALPGQLEGAAEMGLEAIGRELRERLNGGESDDVPDDGSVSVPVYYGKP